MKKLLRILSIFIINVNMIISTVACCECSGTSSLSSVLTINDLAKIYVGLAAIPTSDTIKNAIKENNKDIDTNALIISDITNTNAKVTGDGVKYTGELEVNYISENFEDMGVTISETILSSIIASDGMMYVGTKVNDTQGKLYMLNTSTSEITDITNSGGTNIVRQVTSIEIGANGDIYIGTIIIENNSHGNGHLYKIDKNTNQIVELQNGNIVGGITCLKVSKDNLIYIGTSLDIINWSGVLYVLDNNTLKDITSGGGTNIQGSISCLTIDENDSLYVGTVNNVSGKLYKLEKTTYHATEINSVKDQITNLATGNNNDIYAGGSLYLYRINSITNIVTEINDVVGHITVISINNNHDVYASVQAMSKEILYKIDKTTNFVTNISNLSDGDNINGKIKTITIDTNGNIYICTSIGKIYKTYESI